MRTAFGASLMIVLALFIGTVMTACGDDDAATDGGAGSDGGTAGDTGGGSEEQAFVSIKNDFNNPEASFQPPWTICHAWYGGTTFDTILLGETSAEKTVTAGLGYVYMVAAWGDPTCAPENCLPIASKNEEETVPDQHRTITIGMTNHQGPCPPEGVAPIPEAAYNKILELWPAYGFKSYAERTQNTQCLAK